MSDGRAFVSYSRADSVRVGAIIDGLREAGVEVWIDTRSIEPTADWQAEIRRAVEVSDAAVVFMSSTFFASAHCMDELEWIRESGKKVIPVTLEPISSAQTERWRWLRDVNWIVAETPGDSETTEVAGLIRRAVTSDLEWSSEHARLLVRAREWDLHGRSRARLLRGADIASAEAALVRERPPTQPQPTELQRRYVDASRRARGRYLRVVVGVAVMVALFSSGLAVVAFQQRETARSALAESSFRRLSIEARAATTQSDGLRLALQALDQATSTGRSESEAVAPLIEALARPDVPLMHFPGRPDDNQVSGGRQGTAVSSDGSTLAFSTADSRVHVVDLWRMREVTVLEPMPGALTDFGAGYQVGLDSSGSRLVRVVVPDYPDDGVSFEAELEVYDLTEPEPVRTGSFEVALGSPAAGVAFGPRAGLIVVAEDEGTVSIVDLDHEEPQVQRLGTPETRDAASYVSVNFSADGSRVCSMGAELQLFQVSPPRQLLEVDNPLVYARRQLPCLPDRCGEDAANMMAVNEEYEIECVGPDGSSRGRALATGIAQGDAGSSPVGLVGLRGLDDLTWDTDVADEWDAQRPSGEGVLPSYAWIRGPDDMVRPIEFGVVVPSPTGPALVNVTVDGDIDVWSVGAGTLPAEYYESGVDGVTRVLKGESLSADHPVAGIGAGDGEAVVVDATTGTGLPPERRLRVDPASYDQQEWILGDGRIVTLDEVGAVAVYPAGGGGPRATYDIDLGDDVVIGPVVTVAGEALAYSSGSSLHVINVGTGDAVVPPARADGDSYCGVALSPSGEDLAAVTCGEDGVAELQTWSGVGLLSTAQDVPLPFRRPTAVAISDGGDTVAVAFSLGEVAVLRGRVWIQPPELETTGADHNDYAEGWVNLDARGQWLISRRDGKGVELWRVADDGVSPVAELSHEPRTPMPSASEVTATGVSLAWNAGVGSNVISASGWSLDGVDLRHAACARIAEVTEAGDEQGVPSSLCPHPRGSETSPSTTSTTVSDATSPGITNPPFLFDMNTVSLPEGSFPTAVTVASDGAVWVAASSTDTLVRIGRSGRVQLNPIGETLTSIDDLEPGPSGSIWFSGFMTIGRMGTGGDVSMLAGDSDPTSMTADEGVLSAFIESTEQRTLLRATQASADFVPLSASVADAVAPAMTTLDGSVWFALVAAGGQEFPPSLGVLGDNGQVVLVPLDDVTSITSLATATDGSLWFTATSINGSGILGRRQPNGEITAIKMPSGMVPTQLAATEKGVWFVSDTQLGSVYPSGEVTMWAVPDAEHLGGIAIDADGGLWLTDSAADVVHHLVPVHGE